MVRETQKMRSEALRQTILDTALQIGLEEGFEALSVRKIINRMQYSTSIIYYHFKNKQEIIDALVESESAWLAKKINKVLSLNDPLPQKLEKVFWLVTQVAVSDPEKYNLIVLKKYSDKRAANPHWLNVLSKDLEEAMQAGYVRQMDAYSAAYSIWSSFLGFQLMLSLQEGLTEQRVKELFSIQINILLKGILE